MTSSREMGSAPPGTMPPSFLRTKAEGQREGGIPSSSALLSFPRPPLGAGDAQQVAWAGVTSNWAPRGPPASLLAQVHLVLWGLRFSKQPGTLGWHWGSCKEQSHVPPAGGSHGQLVAEVDLEPGSPFLGLVEGLEAATWSASFQGSGPCACPSQLSSGVPGSVVAKG